MAMSSPSPVHDAYNRICRFLGPSFSRDTFLTFVSACRGRPLATREIPLPVGMTGACFVFRDTDLVVVRAGLSSQRSLITYLHEGVHLLLGHVPPTPMTFADFLMSPNFENAVRRQAGTSYADPDEHVAETLATMLLGHIEQAECETRPDMPVFVQQLYD